MTHTREKGMDTRGDVRPAPEPTNGGYLPQLDGLRTVAVLAVFLFHTEARWFPGGYVGVDVFFVLSGFLITGVLLREHARTGSVSLLGFYLRRARRLLPALLLLAVVLSVAYLVLFQGTLRTQSLLGVLAAVGYATSPIAASGVHLESMLHAWSLSVEEYFYALWPLVVVVVLRRVGRTRLLAVTAAITTAAVLYRVGVALAGWPRDRIYYAADTRAEQLLLGCLLALVLARRQLRVPDWLAAACAMLLGAFVLVPDALTAPFYLYGGSSLIGVAAATIIAALTAARATALSRVMSLRPLVWVGQRSYGVYLWHAPIAGIIGTLVPAAAVSLQLDATATALKLALTLVVAALSYRFVERRVMRMRPHRARLSARPV
ncbi:acyltransferase family protein [Xylanimonas ulmi]|uniref:Peptidoglycan/LPS O-acetylase OafA/YrhL n=1 Tax=Xylanimonas ulmi TaxID=228973 RepID=A0A4Q7M2Z9_9MICO|nr:acyltransferase [Xylanibacterium ulmi]RZS61323.1 peptidoglycan/LPS O-acetylase OafA/YrhL [Xylanibacterium ulmi]